ncbi:MAG TPA: hypothetical protein VLA61_20435 [Ideonella sp.]|uniref:hypothetical protein n=1 Tax=Ideonella sp. TaxID=1929293 RepID=UPI002C76816E|nr:hypothetical protein [Ideonella sp.]HSI50644.1 hypothetical protein [Ideonella sp.]
MRRWPHLDTGRQTSSILGADEDRPHIAWDLGTRRLAVSRGQDITILTIEV